MRKWAKKYLPVVLGMVLGAVAGYFYWQQVGCISDSCAITSSWVSSTIYGTVMGGLLLPLFQKKNNNTV